MTEQLKELIYQPEEAFSNLDYAVIKRAKEEIKMEKDKRFHGQLKKIMEVVDPLTKRSVEVVREKGSPSWLTALPLKQCGFILNK